MLPPGPRSSLQQRHQSLQPAAQQGRTHEQRAHQQRCWHQTQLHAHCMDRGIEVNLTAAGMHALGQGRHSKAPRALPKDASH